MDKYTYRDYLQDIFHNALQKTKDWFQIKEWKQLIIPGLIQIIGFILICICGLWSSMLTGIVEKLVVGLIGILLFLLSFKINFLFYSPYRICKELKEKESLSKYYSTSIRITKTPDNRGLNLYNLSDSIFSGSIYLLAVIELNDFPALPLQTVDGESELTLLPKIPKRVNLVELTDDNSGYVGDKSRIVNYKDGYNTLVIRLSGEFKGYTKVVTDESLWILQFNKQSNTIELEKKYSNPSS